MFRDFRIALLNRSLRISQVVLVAGLLPLGLAAQVAPVPLVGPELPGGPAAPPPSDVPDVFRVLATSGSFLGVGVREVDSARARELKMKEEYGVEITRVEKDSPAEKAGLKANDVVLQYNGQRVEGTEQFVRMVHETPVGRLVKLTVWRAGSTETMTATIGSRKSTGAFAIAPLEGTRLRTPEFQMVLPDIPKATMSWRSPMLGVDAESLGDSQLASFFGVKDGVLVRSVMAGSAAEKAGIKAGDVLTKVGDTTVTSPRDITTALRSARTGGKNSLPVSLVRDRKEMSLTVALEDDSAPVERQRSRRVSTPQN
jgi:serine protease Do